MNKAYWKYFLAVLLFGSNGIVASQIHLSSYEIVLLRTMLGSVLLVGLFFAGRGKLDFYRHKKDAACLAVSGIAMGASWMLLYEAYARIGVSVATGLYYCGPVIVMVLSPVLFREKLTAHKIAGFIVVLLGVFLVNGSASGGKADGLGYACGLLSALMYAFMVIFNKKAGKITGMENAMVQMLVSFLTVAVFVGLRQGLSLEIAGGDWPWILLLGLVNTGIGCYFYFSSIGFLPVQTVAVCGYLEPLSAVLLSAVILGETMRPLQILGAVCILGGALFGELYREKR